jgi:hypothetical protein
MDFQLYDTSVITEAIKTHHNIYDFPIKDLAAENIFANFVKKNFKGDVVWQIGSHKPGADVFIKKELKTLGYSIKSAKEPQKGQWFSISSYRTTKWKTLEDKVQFIREAEKVIAGYAVFARIEFKMKPRMALLYNVYLIAPELLDINSFTIGKQDAKGNYQGENKNGVKLAIVENMSDQVWYKLPMTLIKKSDMVSKLCTVGPIEMNLWNDK